MGGGGGGGELFVCKPFSTINRMFWTNKLVVDIRDFSNVLSYINNGVCCYSTYTVTLCSITFQCYSDSATGEENHIIVCIGK